MTKCGVVGTAFFVLSMMVDAWGQPARAPYRAVQVQTDRPMNIGRGFARAAISSTMPASRIKGLGALIGPYVISETIKCDNAAWLQVRFVSVNLGGRSTLRIRAKRDGASQTFNNQTIREWGNLSAIFNGDTIEVTMNVPPGEKVTPYEIAKVLVGEKVSSIGVDDTLRGNARAICKPNDDRNRFEHAGVGRIMPVGCTGWILSGNIFLTAGHCHDRDMQILQFNVPTSLNDGTPVMPHPKNQYAIIPSTVTSKDEGLGNDWAVFKVASNTETGRLPEEAQHRTFRLRRNLTPLVVSLIGFGVDNRPRGPHKPYFRNRNSQTLQASSGGYLGPDGLSTFVKYRVDAEGASSGSPIVAVSSDGTLTDVAVGIHTDGACDLETWGANVGTSIANEELWNTINSSQALP